MTAKSKKVATKLKRRPARFKKSIVEADKIVAKLKKIYKYVGPESIDKVFQSSAAVTLKCGLPKDFNDPYELFLTIDFNERPDALAFYADAIGELPQLPTTCFSRSPIVTPMWAHYAQNLQGFVVEFSEDALGKAFPEGSFDDVDYADAPSEGLRQMLYMAFVARKFRHTYLLRRGVFNAAYFTKASCWSYEQERRMIVPLENTRQVDPLILLNVPNDCATSIICGPRASEQTKLELIKKAKELNCQYFELRIGRSSATPYLVDTDGQPFLFDHGEISPSPQYCAACNEPITSMTDDHCSWCQIDDELRYNAAQSNPFRMLDHYGMLEQYIEDMDAISQRRKT